MSPSSYSSPKCHYLACNLSLSFLYSYRPGSLDVSFIRSELALGTQEDWQKFESGVNLVYTDASKMRIDCKSSTADSVATQ